MRKSIFMQVEMIIGEFSAARAGMFIPD